MILKEYPGRDGSKVVVRQMTDRHLSNALKWFTQRVNQLEDEVASAEAAADNAPDFAGGAHHLDKAVEWELALDEAENILESLEAEEARRRNEIQPAARISHPELHAIDKPVSTGGGEESGTE
jgi:hypothetical protein